jgi:hypothetical protein
MWEGVKEREPRKDRRGKEGGRARGHVIDCTLLGEFLGGEGQGYELGLWMISSMRTKYTYLEVRSDGMAWLRAKEEQGDTSAPHLPFSPSPCLLAWTYVW